MAIRPLVRIIFGSQLYGTATPQSDEDFLGVFVPDPTDILLQRAPGTMTVGGRPKAVGERNLPGDVDDKAYSLQRFLGLAAEGQTEALDMLFAPLEMIMSLSPEWAEILRNRKRLLTRRSIVFLSYCRRQANKYGIKGSRVAAARAAQALLSGDHRPDLRTPRLADIRERIEALVRVNPEHMTIVDIAGPLHVDGTTRTMIPHWDVCGRKMPYTQTIKDARFVMDRMVDNYGRRALEAEANQGVDWKALSHSVRVGRQAIELLETGHVTLPRPEAAHLLDIKTGQLEYAAVSAEIEDLLVLVEEAAERSTLPAEANKAWMDQFVARVYREAVRAQ